MISAETFTCLLPRNWSAFLLWMTVIEGNSLVLNIWSGISHCCLFDLIINFLRGDSKLYLAIWLH